MKKLIILTLLISSLKYNILLANMVYISNNFILSGVEKQTGRFFLETLEGDPTNPLDNNKNLLFSKNPTSYIALYINGKTIIYGSSKGTWLRKPYVDGEKIVSAWQYKEVSIINEIRIVNNPSTGFANSIQIYSSILNRGRKAKIGLAIILDVQIGKEEPNFFNVLSKGIFSNEYQLAKNEIPLYWSTANNINEQNIKVAGFLYNYGSIKPDRVIFATWDRLSELWNLSVNTKYDLKRRGTTQFDSAVGVFYDPREIEKEETFETSTSYGLLGGNILTEEDLLLSLNVPKEPKELPITIFGSFINRSSEEIEKLTLELIIPDGFYLTSGEKKIETQKIEPKAIYQSKWAITTDSAGGTFYIKLKAEVFQKNQTKSIEAEEYFYGNFINKSPQASKELEKTQVIVEEKKTYVETTKKKKSSRKSRIEKIEKTIVEIDEIYNSWMEIYRTIFEDKIYKIEQISNAILEIDKDIEYFNKILSNETIKE